MKSEMTFKSASCANALRIIAAFFAVLFVFTHCSCGGNSLNEALPPATYPTGSVEGYLYAPAQMGLSQRNVSATAMDYTPLSGAVVNVTCGGSMKAGTTDANGYYRIEGVKVGTCSLKATKTGFDDIEKQLEVKEKETSLFMVTTDGKQLGKALLEIGTDHSGIAVNFSQGEKNATVFTDSKGIYVVPPLSSFDNGSVKIEASKACEWYIPSSTTVQISDHKLQKQPVPPLTLQLLFKYTVTTDKTVYSKPGDVVNACLNVEYRGNETLTIECNVPPPHLLMRHKESGAYYGKSSWYPVAYEVTFSPKHKTSGGCIKYETNGFDHHGVFEVFMWLCDEYIPECVNPNTRVPQEPVFIEVK